jgi:hypothetical protein
MYIRLEMILGILVMNLSELNLKQINWIRIEIEE